MFLGHYGVALAAKKWAPKTSLGTLVAASLWLDILWPVLVLLDVEHFKIMQGITKVSPFYFTDYPLSHSLVMACAWAGLWALVYFIKETEVRGALVLALLVVSHWILDAVVHQPDLPLTPAEGSPVVGLRLWNSLIGTVVVEGGLFLLGLWLFHQSTKAKDKTGNFAFWGFGLALVAFYIISLVGKLPEDPKLIATGAFAQLLFVAWAYWIDDHRKSA